MTDSVKTFFAYIGAVWLQLLAWLQAPSSGLHFEQWLALIVAVPTSLHICLKIYETWKNIRKNHP